MGITFTAGKVIFAWYLILRTLEGGLVIGPYEQKTECEEVMVRSVANLSLAGVELTLAACVFKQEV